MSGPAINQGVLPAGEFLRANMHAISETILTHDAGIDRGVYVCPCGMRGTEHEWEQHIAERVLDKLVPEQQGVLSI